MKINYRYHSEWGGRSVTGDVRVSLCSEWEVGYFQVEILNSRTGEWKIPTGWDEFFPSKLTEVEMNGRIPYLAYCQMARFLEVAYRNYGRVLDPYWQTVLSEMSFEDWCGTADSFVLNEESYDEV